MGYGSFFVLNLLLNERERQKHMVSKMVANFWHNQRSEF